MQSKIFSFWFLVFILTFCLFDLYAMDSDLWTMPVAPSGGIIWRDRAVEVNGIPARATHLYSDSRTDEILDFYQDSLLKNGWQLKDDFGPQNIMAFTRDERFMYVAVRDNGKDMPSDVYLLSSPGDLALCRMIASFMKGTDSLVEKDLPGKDISDIPRYPTSRRMLSIFAPEEGAILLYQAKGNPKEITKFYQSNLKANGWELLQALRPEFLQGRFPDLPEVGVLIFEKGNDVLVININPINKDEKGPNKLNLITIAKNMLEELGSTITPIEEGE